MDKIQYAATHVLFDWDGTLLNSYEADVRAYLTMFGAMGVAWTEAQIAKHYSPNWYRVYRAARIQRRHWEKADALWAKAYASENPPLLPGARRVIRALAKRFTLGIVTSGNRARVRRQLRELELAKYFSACVCSEDVPHKKPHPAPLRLALKRLRVRPEVCVYVGDTAEDMEMSARAGVRAIGVLGPFPTAERIRATKPEVLMTGIGELPEYLIQGQRRNISQRKPRKAEGTERLKTLR
jgi:HAD superfamily hydrolase (TIGR01509 family)